MYIYIVHCYSNSTKWWDDEICNKREGLVQANEVMSLCVPHLYVPKGYKSYRVLALANLASNFNLLKLVFTK